MAIYKTGRYEGVTNGYTPDVGHADAGASLDMSRQPLLHKLYFLDRVERLWGKGVAQLMFRRIGLPAVPPPPPGPLDEARLLLRTILDAQATPQGPRVRDLLLDALEDGEEARLSLLACGIRAYADSQTFVIATMSPWLARVLEGTEWARGLGAAMVLRRLPGTRASGPVRMGPVQPRGTCFPADMLDEFAH